MFHSCVHSNHCLCESCALCKKKIFCWSPNNTQLPLYEQQTIETFLKVSSVGQRLTYRFTNIFGMNYPFKCWLHSSHVNVKCTTFYLLWNTTAQTLKSVFLWFHETFLELSGPWLRSALLLLRKISVLSHRSEVSVHVCFIHSRSWLSFWSWQRLWFPTQLIFANFPFCVAVGNRDSRPWCPIEEH